MNESTKRSSRSLDPVLYAYALDLVAARDYTAANLLRKLSVKGSHEAACAVLNHLQDKGYQSDARYAECYIRYRSKSGFGPGHIRLSLRAKGVKHQDIELGFRQVEIDWCDVLNRAYQKKYRDTSPKDIKERSKRSQFLQRRGFSIDLIRQLF